MRIPLVIQNVRDHYIKSQDRKIKRVIMRDPENTVESFFHFDCDNEDQASNFANLIGKETQFEIHGFNTNYSDTIAVQGLNLPASGGK